MDYLELFDYFKKARAKLVESLEKLTNEEFTKNRGLSFDSIKDVITHTIMVEDNWLHYRYAGLGAGTDRKFQEFKNITDVKSYMSEVDDKTAKLFQKLAEADLQKPVKRPLPNGGVTVYSLENVLYHVPIEIIYHYGEIFAEFWKMNIDAPYYSYLGYSEQRA
ncbi:MAG: DinB family protein [Candidatus Bathyarchaeia archaeon]